MEDTNAQLDLEESVIDTPQSEEQLELNFRGADDSNKDDPSATDIVVQRLVAEAFKPHESVLDIGFLLQLFLEGTILVKYKECESSYTIGEMASALYRVYEDTKKYREGTVEKLSLYQEGT